MHAQEQVLTPDSTHRVAARWKRLSVMLALPLAGLMAWAIVLIVQDLRSGTGRENAWLLIPMLAALGALMLLALAALVWGFRARITLSGDTMALRGISRTRLLSARHLEGYRWIKGQLYLYPKSDQWPVTLSNFENQAALKDWVLRHAVDLTDPTADELAEEDKRIGRDLTLGATDAQKEERLARLRRLTKRMNRVAYAAAAVGVCNALFLHGPIVRQAATGVLILMPIGMIVLALKNPGHVRIDSPKGSRYPQILSGILACGAALWLMSLSDRHTLLGDTFYRWLVPLAVAQAGILGLIEIERLRELYARGRALAVITVASVLALSAVWAGSAVYEVNKNFDISKTVWSTTEVVDKRRGKKKSSGNYYVEVAPWDGSGGKAVELDASKREYTAVEIGEPVKIGVRRGALEIPWVAEIRPGIRPSKR
jgi:hypothetical protein